MFSLCLVLESYSRVRAIILPAYISRIKIKQGAEFYGVTDSFFPGRFYAPITFYYSIVKTRLEIYVKI